MRAVRRAHVRAVTDGVAVLDAHDLGDRGALVRQARRARCAWSSAAARAGAAPLSASAATAARTIVRIENLRDYGSANAVIVALVGCL